MTSPAQEPMLPKTLIQLHYHDRPCGVMRVIRAYARAFSSLVPDGRNLLVCARQSLEAMPEFPKGSVMDLPEAGYCNYKGTRRLRSDHRSIFDCVSTLLCSPRMEFPAAILAHNLTLCKNGALVCAFSDLASLFGQDPERFRFFSVAHDFAEEGRADLLMTMSRLEKMGIAVRAARSAMNAPVHFIAVGSRPHAVLRRAGHRVSLLENPVAAFSSMRHAPSKKGLISRLAHHASGHGISFCPQAPIVAYPARTIARKNPLEAVAVACLLARSTLLLGPAGPSPADRRLHLSLEALASRHGLPVITGVQSVLSDGNDPMRNIYRVADVVLSTSVAEGFGFLLYEPLLAGRGVIGRRPLGFGYPPGVADRLYGRLPVPAAWVDGEKLCRSHLRIVEMILDESASRCFRRRLGEELSGDLVDFALLDEKMQMALIDRLACSPEMLDEWRALLQRRRAGWPGLACLASIDRGVIERERRVVARAFGFEKMTSTFAGILSCNPYGSLRRVHLEVIGQKFSDPRCFRVR